MRATGTLVPMPLFIEELPPLAVETAPGVAATRALAAAVPSGPRLAPYAPALASAAVCAAFAALLPAVADYETIRLAWPWIPGLGVELSFTIDGLSLTFALLITGVGALVLAYSASYLKGQPKLVQLLSLLGLFELAMLGLVLADNLILMFVFWELTTVTSFLLVGFDHEEADARNKALQALLVTAAGGLALLAGILLIGAVAGTLEASALPDAAAALKADPLYPAILVLVLLGAFTKSAQFPFHFWLPNAMAAPTPVSAYLHSVTMVKAGIYLLARLTPALGGTGPWLWTLTIVGGVTAVLASIWALRQTDLKLTLAYTTVMALGTLTMFLGGASAIALAAAMTFLIVHAFYKAALFLAVGILDKKAGSREVDALGGLARPMWRTWLVVLLAAFSMAGFPPFLGFVGKELQYEGALAVASEPLLVLIFAVAANAMMVAVAAMVAIKPFLGARTGAAAKAAAAGEPPFAMWLGPAVLALGGLVFGIAPELVGSGLVNPTASVMVGDRVDKEFKLWHGVNVPLVLSLVTFALGLLIYLGLGPIRRRLAAAEARGLWAAESGYDRLLAGTKALAAWQTRLIQTGRHTQYVFCTLAVLAALLWGGLAMGGFALMPRALEPISLIEFAMLALAAFGAIATVVTRSRLLAILALGLLGSTLAAIFVFYGAIDVAMTQLLVETLIVVIVSVALLKLPRLTPNPGLEVRWRHLGVAVATGVATALALMAVLSTELDRQVTDFFEAASYPEALGRNIVNVILVDFRALDTLGEIAVVVIAALGAVALLRPKGERREGAR
ncbi:MAG: hydrogen gas-evolving membrane-bound hydrogenase subunit E [Alphaproteobacteria bacterium]